MFELLPILDQMIALYEMPRSRERFDTYLHMLQGESKADMVLPIAGYNPMGNEHVLRRVTQLRDIKAEEIIADYISAIDKDLFTGLFNTFQVVINVIDDLGGAWSEHCSTDYTNTFKIAPLIERNFCTPYFWTSEEYNKDLIRERTALQTFRTIYQVNHGTPVSLEDHIKQEVYAYQRTPRLNSKICTEELSEIRDFYNEHKTSEDYALIFNFLYGDKASDALGYKCWGHIENAGAKYIIHKSNS